jgi:monothiol glutaredoxin
MSTTLEKIQRQIAENPILLYMKGSPKLPSCGFSAQAVQALSACGERFAYVDILQNPDIRASCRNTLTGRPSRSCGLTVNWLAAATS